MGFGNTGFGNTAGFGSDDFFFRGDLFGPSPRDSRLALFAQGRSSDRAVPNAWQVMVLSDVSGPDGSCPGAAMTRPSGSSASGSRSAAGWSHASWPWSVS